jgi:acetyltransferase-like isoleucine patch superfamily enzyme
LHPGLHLKGQASIRGKFQYEPPVMVWNGVSLRDVRLGAYSYVAPHTNIVGTVIGRYCSIGDHGLIGPAEHPVDWLTTHPMTHVALFPEQGDSPPLQAFERVRPTTIGHDVWIGAHAKIRGGVNIGNGAVIAMGAVVTRDVPDFAIVGGVPAKPIRQRFDAALQEKIQRLGWWDYDWPALAERTWDWSRPEQALAEMERYIVEGRVRKIGSRPE